MLTKREYQVYILISQGLSNQEIAKSRCVSVHTVKSHVKAIMAKLGLHTRLKLALHAHEQLAAMMESIP